MFCQLFIVNKDIWPVYVAVQSLHLTLYTTRSSLLSIILVCLRKCVVWGN